VYRLGSILEIFVAHAWISSIACAEARAHIAALPMDDSYPHPSDYAVKAMHECVRWDLIRIQSARQHGDCFANLDSLKGEVPFWFKRHEERLAAYKNAA
jgi:hypothetical protein